MNTIESVARHRVIQKLKPGYWWQGEFDTGVIWVRVDLIMETENVITGKRLVRLYGTDPNETGERRGVLHVDLRGKTVLSITEAQARRSGLVVSEEVAS